ncbi:MAG TPA: type II secretion system protein [Candidatus Paceibacterota bacterium]
MKHTSQKGFTLIELLVVIAIIGILSSVVLASLNSARKKGRDARRISDVKQVQLALELYYDSNGSYPTGIYGTTLTTPGFISAVPTDPSDSVACTDGTQTSCYDYDQTQTGSSYELGTGLETSGHTVLGTDAADSTVVAGGNLTAGADTAGCSGGAGRYCYNVIP